MAYRFVTVNHGVVSKCGWILDFASDKDAFEYLKAYNEMMELIGFPTRLECLDIPLKVKVENTEFEWI